MKNNNFPSNETQKDIEDFFKENGNNEINKVNGFCVLGKEVCPYTGIKKCRGQCTA